MNDDILEGQWKQLKGEVKTWWGKLTDNEVDQVAGHREKLAGILQERYGYSKEQALDQINYFLENVEEKLKMRGEKEPVR